MFPSSGPLLRAVTCSSLEELAPWRAGWDALAELEGRPCGNPDWCLAFWREHHEPGGSRLQVVLAVEPGGEVVGVVPLSAPPSGSDGDHWVLGAGWGHGRTAPLAAAGREAPVARALAEELVRTGPPQALRFPATPASVGFAGHLAAAWPGRGAVLLHEQTMPNPVVELHPDGFAFWLADRSANFRKGLRKATRRVEADGAVLRRSETPDQLESDLRALWALHQERFAAKGVRSSIDDVAERAVSGAARALFAQGRTHLWVADHDGEAVGAELLLEGGRRWAAITGGARTDWEHRSLGHVLVGQAVRDAHERGAEVVDLGAGAHPYKWRWAEHDDPLVWSSVVVRGPGAARRLARHAAAQGVGRARAAARRRLSEERRKALRARLSRVRPG